MELPKIGAPDKDATHIPEEIVQPKTKQGM